MLKGIRVGIADDHPFLRKALRSLLEGHRCSVVAEADTGLEAIDMVDKHRPDVVIIDPLLPQIDGLEVTRILTSKYPQTRVVVYAPFSDDRVKTRALDAGAWHVVKKERYITGLISIIRSQITTKNFGVTS
jgi:DNA-binding NarL/FixJ family response regulator